MGFYFVDDGLILNCFRDENKFFSYGTYIHTGIRDAFSKPSTKLTRNFPQVFLKYPADRYVDIQKTEE